MKNLVFVSMGIAITVILCIGASKYAPGTTAGSVTHDNNNYWLEVCPEIYEGPFEQGSGEYPGGSGILNLFTSYCWVGVEGDSGIYVSDSYIYGDREMVFLQDDIYTTSSYWPGGLPTFGDFDAYAFCNDANATENGPIPINIARHTWSFSGPTQDDFVGFKYIIRNRSAETFDTVYVTHVADFDIGGSSDSTDDAVGCDAGRNLAYMYDYDAMPDNYVGIVAAGEGWTSVGMDYWDIFTDPQTDVERFGIQSGCGWYSVSAPYDFRICMTFEFNSGDFEPNETIIVGFYQVAGGSLNELRDNADAAVASYEGGGGYAGIESASLGAIKALFK